MYMYTHTLMTSRIYVLQRWQRRFFVLYDDGELTYSVDENVSAQLSVTSVFQVFHS